MSYWDFFKNSLRNSYDDSDSLLGSSWDDPNSVLGSSWDDPYSLQRSSWESLGKLLIHPPDGLRDPLRSSRKPGDSVPYSYRGGEVYAHSLFIPIFHIHMIISRLFTDEWMLHGIYQPIPVSFLTDESMLSRGITACSSIPGASYVYSKDIYVWVCCLWMSSVAVVCGS